MAVLKWDELGERRYQTGVSHGVLYLHDGKAVVWNGLTSIEETSNSERKSFYLDGVKFLENLTPGDFQGTIKAFTYPDEFDLVNGIVKVVPGLAYYDQPPKSFDLTYRTNIGDAIEPDRGYKIHLLYNVLANPDTYTFPSIGQTVEPVEFSWDLTGTPPMIKGNRPTVHLSIDSTDMDQADLDLIEDILYGTEDTDARLPSIYELSELFGYRGGLLIIDNGDGTWTAVDNSSTYITMINDTTFQIDGADATYLDATTYTISSTNAD
jgi:hypothetical protein